MKKVLRSQTSLRLQLGQIPSLCGIAYSAAQPVSQAGRWPARFSSNFGCPGTEWLETSVQGGADGFPRPGGRRIQLPRPGGRTRPPKPPESGCQGQEGHTTITTPGWLGRRKGGREALPCNRAARGRSGNRSWAGHPRGATAIARFARRARLSAGRLRGGKNRKSPSPP
jgi:hypothetical protein